MSDQKIKTSHVKVPLNLVPLRALQGCARVRQHGDIKYDPGNYIKATDDEMWNRYAGAALRHLEGMQLEQGAFDRQSVSALDDESGLPHIDHLISSLVMLRALTIKHNVLPADPGPSKFVQAKSNEPTSINAAMSFKDLRTGARVRAVAPTGLETDGTIESTRSSAHGETQYYVTFIGPHCADWYYAHNLTGIQWSEP